jgi:thiol:disulfide interchange protein DsbD
MKSWIKILFGLLLLFPFAAALPAQERDPFRIDFQDRVLDVRPGDIVTLSVGFKVPEGYYLYDGKTSILFDKTDGLTLVQSERPKPEPHLDPFLKKTVPVYFKDFAQTLVLTVPADAKPGRRTLEATLRYQGCSEEFCYRPIKRTILWPVEILPKEGELRPARVEPPTGQIEARPSAPPPQPSWREMLKESNPERLLEQGKIYVLGLAVLPIIPLTLAFVGVRKAKRGNFLKALALVGGMVAMYSILGFLAASLGLKLGFLFQSRWFLLLTAVFFFVFSLALFDLIPFRLPQGLQQRLTRSGGQSFWGTFIAGLTVGLIASPCVGPVIGPLLLIAARGQDRFYGFLLLLAYGVGMGLLFLVLGTAYGRFGSLLRGGAWTRVLKKGMAVLLLAPAFYYGYVFAKPLLAKPVEGQWVKQLEKGLSLAQESRKPLLIDFYADWCPPCQELDHKTFSSPEVKAFAENFVMVKVDCTTDDDQCRKATEKYEVVGWPTVLFLDSRGRPIPDVKLVGGFADKYEMLALMRQALEKNL